MTHGTGSASPMRAFGIADINPERDVDGKMVRSAITVIRGGVEGLSLALGAAV